MVDWDITEKLMRAFSNSFITYLGEIIVHRNSNQYFILKNCETELDVKCKVLEWLSRAAYKTAPYATQKKNDELHSFILKGINTYLNTSFTCDDMELIYTYLGNSCNHKLTEQFVLSGYDMEILRKKELR